MFPFPVCSAKVIYESDLMQDFLQMRRSDNHQAEGGANTGGGVVSAVARQPSTPVEKEVQLKILMPDKTITTVTINEFWRANEVYEVGLWTDVHDNKDIISVM